MGVGLPRPLKYVARAVGVCGEAVGGTDLEWRVGGGGRRGGREAHVGAGLRAVVDAENRGDHAGQCVGQHQRPGAVAVDYAIRGLWVRGAHLGERGAEGFAEVRHGSGDHDAARAGVGVDQLDAVADQGFAHVLDVVGVRAVLAAQLVAGQQAASREDVGGQILPTPKIE